MSTGSFKNVTEKTIRLQIIKQDLALRNLHGLICHKTQPANQSNISVTGHILQFLFAVGLIAVIKVLSTSAWG